MYCFAMVRKTLTREEVEDLVVGATILGVGGGGSPAKGLARLLEVMDSGGRLLIASLDEFHDEGSPCKSIFCWMVATLESKASRKTTVKDPVRRPSRCWNRVWERNSQGLLPQKSEEATQAACLAIAGKPGIPMVDGDFMGRAGPEASPEYHADIQLLNGSFRDRK